MKLYLVLVVLAASLGVGCTSAKVRYQYDQAEQYVYTKPIQSVWPAVRTYVFERGWKVMDKTVTDSAYYFETAWVEDAVLKQRKRYLIQGTPVGSDKSRITVNTVTENEARTWSVPGRDLETEWALLNRIDPAGAAKIQADSEKVQ